MASLSRKRIIGALFAIVFSAAACPAMCAEPMAGGYNLPSRDDEQQIRTVLSNYTQSVTDGNRALFESQLLDAAIPFSGIGSKRKPGKADLATVQNYADFRATIFDSGVKYRQRFSNIKIEQLGNLAQVSLDYETSVQGEDYKGKGWKVLQLVKVDMQWKIASEFWTGYPAR